MSVPAKAEESTRARELIASAVRSIDAADQFSLPFPHIFFQDFFPKDFYGATIP